MTTPGTPASTAGARAATYLDDLARMLADLDPADRDEVLAGVREHLDTTLAEHPDDPSAVDAALVRLGPPERVAAEARGGHPAPPSTSGFGPQPTPPTRPRNPKRARLAATASLALLALPVLAVLAARIVTELVGPAPGSGVGWPDSVALVPHAAEVLGLLPPLFVVWLVAVLVATVGPDLRGGTTAWLVLLGPLMSIGVLVATLLADPRSVGTPVSLVVLVALAVAITRTGRRVWRETRI